MCEFGERDSGAVSFFIRTLRGGRGVSGLGGLKTCENGLFKEVSYPTALPVKPP